MNISKIALTGLALGAATVAMAPNSAKAEWPERPITAVVMYAAGGGTDSILRALSAEMQKSMGAKINVINKPGAVGALATKFVLGKKSDGYTLLGAANYNKFARVKGGSDSASWKDWYYMQAATSLASWSVRPNSPFKSFQDIVKAAKANPGKVSISTSGSGGLWHELAAIVAQSAGIELKYVPYKGGKPATLAGLNGETDIAGGGVHEHIAFIDSGKLRSIQQTGTSDIKTDTGKLMPSLGGIVPALKDQLPFSGIYNIGIKRDTPIEVIRKLQQAFVSAVNSNSFKKLIRTKRFRLDVKLGEAADRRAAQLEAITAATFAKLGIKGAKSAKELGLPTPAGFDKWWPPKGYKPLPL